MSIKLEEFFLLVVFSKQKITPSPEKTDDIINCLPKQPAGGSPLTVIINYPCDTLVRYRNNMQVPTCVYKSTLFSFQRPTRGAGLNLESSNVRISSLADCGVQGAPAHKVQDKVASCKHTRTATMNYTSRLDTRRPHIPVHKVI